MLSPFNRVILKKCLRRRHYCKNTDNDKLLEDLIKQGKYKVDKDGFVILDEDYEFYDGPEIVYEGQGKKMSLDDKLDKVFDDKESQESELKDKKESEVKESYFDKKLEELRPYLELRRNEVKRALGDPNTIDISQLGIKQISKDEIEKEISATKDFMKYVKYDHDTFSPLHKSFKYSYDCIYEDKFGKEYTVVQSNGSKLSVKIRGYRFDSYDFFEWRPVEIHTLDESIRTLFEFHQVNSKALMPHVGAPSKAEALNNVSLDVNIPTKLSQIGKDGVEGLLDVTLNVKLTHNQNENSLQLTLRFMDITFKSKGKTSNFNIELADIQRNLPDGMFIKSCWNCALSEYSPITNLSYGGLGCFSENQELIKNVDSIRSLFRIWSSKSKNVQETFLCDSFKLRTTPRYGGRK